MPRDEVGSISRLLIDLKAGDPMAAQPLWERYYERLVRLARQRLRGRRKGAVEDEEDAALSAFESFFQGAADGRFPRLDDRQDLWRLLVVITARKVSGQVARQHAQRRGGGLDAALAEGLDRIIGDEPTPDFAAEVAEQYSRLLGLLEGPELRRVAVWRMEGFSNDEIAERLGCARRTVARRLDLIRQVWAEEARAESGASP
ncbi:MAG: ECF-type sigma factor [Isosphaeraceae bacterium]